MDTNPLWVKIMRMQSERERVARTAASEKFFAVGEVPMRSRRDDASGSSRRRKQLSTGKTQPGARVKSEQRTKKRR